MNTGPQSATPVPSIRTTLQQAQQLENDLGHAARLLKVIVWPFLWSLSLSVEVFLHRRFGERYLNPLACVFTVALMVLLIAVSDLESNPIGVIALVHLVAFVIAACAQWAMAMSRSAAKKAQWHSRSAGISWLVPRLIPKQHVWTTHALIEPTIVFLAGVVIASTWLWGVLLIAAAVAMTTKSLLQLHTLRSKVMDARDAEIESAAIIHEVKGEPSRGIDDIHGYVRPAIAR
jgi:hypothetical protein